jgi:hypothetical protein
MRGTFADIDSKTNTLLGALLIMGLIEKQHK